MRTTLVLDDHLLKQAKARAAAQGTTLSEVVGQALRSALAEPVSAPAAFRMLTFGDAAASYHHQPRDFADAPRDDDRRRLRP